MMVLFLQMVLPIPNTQYPKPNTLSTSAKGQGLKAKGFFAFPKTQNPIPNTHLRLFFYESYYFILHFSDVDTRCVMAHIQCMVGVHCNAFYQCAHGVVDGYIAKLR